MILQRTARVLMSKLEQEPVQLVFIAFLLALAEGLEKAEVIFPCPATGRREDVGFPSGYRRSQSALRAKALAHKCALDAGTLFEAIALCITQALACVVKNHVHFIVLKE